MLGNNKFTTYLLYAIGEISLVVIGILIAVSIDEWNEERKNAQEAEFQLTKVEEDLIADKVKIAQVLSENQKYIESLIICMQVFTNDTTLTKTDFHSQFQYMTMTNAFVPTRGAFEGLISSGKIQLISNQKLLNSLLSYYNDSDYMAWNTSIEDYSRNVIVPYLMNFDHSPNVNGDGQKFFTQFDLSEFAIAGKSLEDYKRDQFILNATRLKIELFEGQQAAYQKLQHEINKVLNLLGEEIQ